MKKILGIVAAMAVVLASCGGDGTESVSAVGGGSGLLTDLEEPLGGSVEVKEAEEKSSASRGGNILLALVAFAAWLALYRARQAAERTETTVDDAVVKWLRRIVYGGPLLLAGTTALLGSLLGVCSETAKGVLFAVFGAWWWWLCVVVLAILSDWYLDDLVPNKGWVVRWTPVLAGWLAITAAAAY